MRPLYPAHWALALLLAAALHLLLLAGMPRPASVSGDSGGARTVTINLGSAVIRTRTTPSQPDVAPPAPMSGAERQREPGARSAEQSTPSAEPVVPQRDDEMKPAPETATGAEQRPPQKAERNKTDSKNVSQNPEKEINPSDSPVGADQSAESSARQIASYFGELRQWLAEHRRYPRRARMRRLEGTAVLEIELTADGRVRMSRISSSSGHQRLDEAAREMLSRARPLPPPPKELDVAGRVITVPVDFSLR